MLNLKNVYHDCELIRYHVLVFLAKGEMYFFFYKHVLNLWVILKSELSIIFHYTRTHTQFSVLKNLLLETYVDIQYTLNVHGYWLSLEERKSERGYKAKLL